MPSLLMFPFIQCHHTRGRALCGGSTKPLFRESPPASDGVAFDLRPGPAAAHEQREHARYYREALHAFAEPLILSFIIIFRFLVQNVVLGAFAAKTQYTLNPEAPAENQKG